MTFQRIHLNAISALLLPLVSFFIQNAEATQQRARANNAALDTRSFDPHDLSGIWSRTGGDRGINRERLNDVPVMTPEGEAKFNDNKPARGRVLGEPLNGEHPGRVRAIVPALSNDPIMNCDPQGFPRLLLDNEPVEFLQLGGRMLQYFQQGHTVREIWTDGRELPSGEALDNMGVSWFGMSVGKWEGDTLVVHTVGLDDRTWLDIYGFPHSAELRVEERYRRTSYNVIEWKLTLYDPKIYKTPWESDTKAFTRVPKEGATLSGWYGFSGPMEDICAPSNEIENFNKRIRDPAGLGKK